MAITENTTERRLRVVDKVTAVRELVWARTGPGVKGSYSRLTSALRISERAIEEDNDKRATLYLDSAEATIALLYALHAISQEDQG